MHTFFLGPYSDVYLRLLLLIELLLMQHFPSCHYFFLFQGLHLISPNDYSLIQVTGARTLDVIAGSIIAMITVGLLSFRSYQVNIN